MTINDYKNLDLVADYILYFFLSLTVIPTILFIFFSLLLLEWIAYSGLKSGPIVGCTVAGGIIYAVSSALEYYAGDILRILSALIS